jgi:hypothetical protein
MGVIDSIKNALKDDPPYVPKVVSPQNFGNGVLFFECGTPDFVISLAKWVSDNKDKTICAISPYLKYAEGSGYAAGVRTSYYVGYIVVVK